MVGDLPEDKVRMTIVVDRKAAEKVEELAKKIGISKSKMARNLMYCGLDDAQILNKLGLYDATIAVKHLKELIKAKLL